MVLTFLIYLALEGIFIRNHYPVIIQFRDMSKFEGSSKKEVSLIKKVKFKKSFEKKVSTIQKKFEN